MTVYMSVVRIVLNLSMKDTVLPSTKAMSIRHESLKIGKSLSILKIKSQGMSTSLIIKLLVFYPTAMPEGMNAITKRSKMQKYAKHGT